MVGRLLLGIFPYVMSLTLSEGAVHEWGYHHGVKPEKWKNIFPKCDGWEQSPIDIRTNQVMMDYTLDKFNFGGLSVAKRVKMDIKNNGHAVQVNLKGKGLEISGGRLPGQYHVEQFHFHWGSEDSRGSEHEINGEHFPMEMHVVTHSSRFSGGVKEAMKHRNGLAVLGFLFKVGKHNANFDEIISHLKKIQHKDDHVLLTTFDLNSLFPSTDCFYRYYGSLTTPTCDESVIWTIFKEKINISESQLNEFRNLGKTHYKGSEDLINNYRNPQPMNARIITTNCQKCISKATSGFDWDSFLEGLF